MQMHLFDINIPGQITFQESLVLGPGNSLGTFNAGLLIFRFFVVCFLICELSSLPCNPPYREL